MEENSYSQKLSIKSWSEDDRPREKLMTKGRAALSDAELLAILINSGTKKYTAVDLAKLILQKAGNDLNRLGKLSLNELMAFDGIGEARAITIIGALELGRRRKDTPGENKSFVRSSKEAYDYIRPHLMDLQHEEFWVLYLNRSQVVLTARQASIGGTAGTVADPRIIFRTAVSTPGCTGIIMVHNHPSGNKAPSHADITLTKSMKEAGQVLEINVLDHLIYCDDGYYSFADDGNL